MRGKWMLLGAALCLLVLAACGKGEESPAAWTQDQGQKLLDSGAYSEELEEMDLDTAFLLYRFGDWELEREALAGGMVRRSAGATCEELAVLTFQTEEQAQTAQKALEDYLQVRIEENTDYLPAELPKLESAWLDRRGASVLMVVANDLEAAKAAVGIK